MTTITEAMNADGAALYRLMSWLSPAYPIGAYTYSHGIETAVEAGWITDAATTQAWLCDLIDHGAGFCDAVLLACAHDALSAKDSAALLEVLELASALPPSSELALETQAQGDAFIKITRDAWPCAAIDLLTRQWHGPIALPVAVAAAAAGHNVAKVAAVTCYCHAFAANLISAAVRTVPLGQTDGQRILVRLEPVIHGALARALETPLQSLGTAVMLSDIASMNHETQYTRLFRS